MSGAFAKQENTRAGAFSRAFRFSGEAFQVQSCARATVGVTGVPGVFKLAVSFFDFFFFHFVKLLLLFVVVEVFHKLSCYDLFYKSSFFNNE